ncbi:hypothetical protein ABZW18_06810 [Streptomyces sp. NPDC004647]|uniref:hypothetical protein n=1 Tax=Streptomyces sp. NPDC004647 TaxID=3154671 RepID=UPI0033A9CE25
MESGPAIFAGTVFILFGAALLLWTGARVKLRAPVAYDVSPVASVLLAILFAVASLGLGIWCLGLA